MIQMMRQGERWNKIDMKMERFLMKLKKEGMMMMMMMMMMFMMMMMIEVSYRIQSYFSSL